MDPAGREALRGISVRRLIGKEKKNRVGKKIYIEKELLDALPAKCDLNFEINFALELRLTEHHDLQVQLVRTES